MGAAVSLSGGRLSPEPFVSLTLGCPVRVSQGQGDGEASPPSCVDGGWQPCPSLVGLRVCVFEGLSHGREDKGEGSGDRTGQQAQGGLETDPCLRVMGPSRL